MREPLMAVDVVMREPPGCRAGEGEHGHLEELRATRSRSCAGSEPSAVTSGSSVGRPRRGAAHRGRGERVLLPGPRGGPRPGRGLPVHDARSSARAWSSTHLPSAAARCSTTRPCATSSCGATPRPSPTRSSGWWPAGTTRARSTCSTGSPSSPSTPRRPASSARDSAISSTAASPSSTTTSSRAPTPSPTSIRTRDRELPPPRRCASRAGGAGPGRSWTGGPPGRRRRPTRTATCSTC